MIAGVLLFAALLAPRIAGGLALRIPGGDPGEVVARLRAEPAEVEVGEPCSLVLEVDHPAGSSVGLPDSDPLPDDSWVLLEPRHVVRGARTIATWRVLSLEPGERQLPSIQVDVAEAGGVRKIDVAAGTLSVRSALEAGEDAPRPIRGFRPAPENPAAGRGRLVLLGGLLLAVLAAAFHFRRRAKRKPVPAAVPTALDRLAGLLKCCAEDPESSRRVVYDLSRLLRGSVDAFLRDSRVALADPEWSARIEPDERVPLGVRRSIAGILRDSQRIKYALHAPTRFALETMFADARSALEALASAPPPPPGSAEASAGPAEEAA